MTRSDAIKDIRAFNRFYTNIIGIVDRHILDSPYSLTEVRILYEIYHVRKPTARKIQSFLQIDEGYLSRTIDALSKRGLVQRMRSPGDKRVFLLSLTAKGRKEFRILNRRSNIAIGHLIANLHPRDIDRLRSMLRSIQRLLSKE